MGIQAGREFGLRMESLHHAAAPAAQVKHPRPDS
jgi:hypothetical protein